VRLPLAAHVDDFPVDQLNPLIRIDEASLYHPRQIAAGETPVWELGD